MNEEFMMSNLNDLGSVLQRSKALMEQTKDLPRNKHTPQKPNDDGYGEIPYPTNENYASTNNISDVFSFSESSMANSKLPKEVLEVMAESKRQRNAMSMAVGNDLDPSLITKVNGGNAKKQNLKEQQIKNTLPEQNTGIDYSLIKSIIDESVKKHVSSLKKVMLNENKGSSLELMTQQGNTFKFVTTDGKIFEGKLTYKGKLEK